MGEVFDIFSKKKIKEPSRESDAITEEEPKKILSKEENVDIINSVDSEKYKLIFALKRSYGFDENLPAIQKAREALCTWPKEKIARFINEADEAQINSKPAFFITAVNIILYE